MQTRKGTRYENTRHFAVPLHDAEWQPVELAVFQEESRRAEIFFEQNRIFHRGMASIFFCRPISEEANDVLSRGWIRNYHRRLTECGYWSQEGERYVIRSARQDSFYRSLRRWAKDLSKIAGEMAHDVDEEAEEFTVFYFRSELNDRADNLRRSERELLDIIEKIE